VCQFWQRERAASEEGIEEKMATHIKTFPFAFTRSTWRVFTYS